MGNGIGLNGILLKSDVITVTSFCKKSKAQFVKDLHIGDKIQVVIHTDRIYAFNSTKAILMNLTTGIQYETDSTRLGAYLSKINI